MTQRPPNLLDRVAERRVIGYWEHAGTLAGVADLDALREMRARARRLRRAVDPAIRIAEGRLAQPRIGTNAMNRPKGADWAWRPVPWRLPVTPRGFAAAPSGTLLSEGVSLFHDCPIGEILVRQERNRRPEDLAPFGLALEVLGFAGSFLSLAIDLPDNAVAALGGHHIFRAALDIAVERPMDVVARLNLRTGPNVEQISGRVPVADPAPAVDFDLDSCAVDAARADKIWLDVIFSRPSLNAVRIADLTLSRRPRADL